MKAWFTLAVLVPLLFVGINQVHAEKINFDKCSMDRCFEYIPEQNELVPGTHPNWSMNAFMPDGSCNMKGLIIPTNGNCSVGPIVLSDDNMTNFKKDVAFMAVRDIHTTTEKVTTNFCPLAQYSWDHQTESYQYKLTHPANLTKYVIPDWCQAELHPDIIKIPEFPLIAEFTIIISIMFVVVISRMRK